MTNEGKTVAIEITIEGGAPVPGPIVADLWTGWLQIGSDLDADWCTDAPSSTPVVNENYLIVAGHLIVDEVEGDGACPTIVRARLIEIVADSRNEIIEWDEPVTLVNERWGCFIG